MSLTKKEGFVFSFDSRACALCQGKCCRGESGWIFISQQEMNPIANFLNISIVDLIQNSLIRVNNRFSIKEQWVEGSFDCIFFDVCLNQCSIYPVRPLQCRQYPFWPQFKEDPETLLQECPGVRA